MPGIYITNFKERIEVQEKCTKLLYREKIIDDYSIIQCTIKKFEEDKIFEENKDFFIVTEGIVLNKTELLDKYNKKNLFELILYMYEMGKKEFFKEFRGSFSGAIYDKRERRWNIYTNHYGDSALFFAKKNGRFVVASQFDWVYETIRINGIQCEINEMAVEAMLTYGYMPDSRTYISEIKRVNPGAYINTENDSIEEIQYYRLRRNMVNVKEKTEEEVIDKIDELFRRAVAREFEKDKEYGYKHLVQLSGGLDSRMNYWVAHDLGYRDCLAMTFSQSNYLDEIIAKEIAAYWKDEILVWPLDGAKHMWQIEESREYNYGLSLYSAIGAERRILDAIDIEKYGVMHSGQLGDVVIGTFITDEKDLYKLQVGQAQYSNRMTEYFSENNTWDYSNQEELMMYVRGFWGCLTSHFFTRQYTEMASPFLDVDLMEYCMSIPLEYRIKHNIYIKWIIKKYPEAANFKWEKIRTYINAPIFWRKIRKNIQKVVPEKFLRGKSMNPTELWYECNTELKKYMDDKYKEYREHVEMSSTLMAVVEKIYNDGTALEKVQVLTALSEVYFLQGSGR